MMVTLLLILGIISVLLILSGLIVLLIPSKKRSPKNVSLTLSQALGVAEVEVRLPIEPVYPKQTQIESSFTESVYTDPPPVTYSEPQEPQTSAPCATVVETTTVKQPDISTEQIRQLMIDHERLITLVDGVRKMNNARKEEQVLKTAKNLLQTAESFESAKSQLAMKPYIETVCPDFFGKLNAAVVEELTDFEIRVCLSQIFDLTSKEIAQITNRSVRTIETTVYKIRKKLLIPTEIRLPDFLRSL
jgi:hypothetical protein